MSREGNVMFHLMLTKASKNYRLEMVAESVINVVDSFVQPLKPDIVISKKILGSRGTLQGVEETRREDGRGIVA